MFEVASIFKISVGVATQIRLFVVTIGFGPSATGTVASIDGCTGGAGSVVVVGAAVVDVERPSVDDDAMTPVVGGLADAAVSPIEIGAEVAAVDAASCSDVVDNAAFAWVVGTDECEEPADAQPAAMLKVSSAKAQRRMMLRRYNEGPGSDLLERRMPALDRLCKGRLVTEGLGGFYGFGFAWLRVASSGDGHCGSGLS